MVCDVLVELTHVFIDKTFTYRITKDQEKDISIGMRVTVPFGKQILEGFVINIREDNETADLKQVIDLVDNYAILNKELLELGKYISVTTLSSLMSSYGAMLPKALKAKRKINMNIIYDSYITLNNELNIKLNESQLKIVNIVKDKKEVLKSDLNKVSSSSVKTFLDKKILLEEKKEHYRYQLATNEKSSFTLNEEQEIAYNKIVDSLNKNTVFLIHGVTGSGKTNVYIEVIKKVIESGKKAIVLVPEISLTPQIVNRFTSHFSNIAVLHSGLSDGEKYDEWRKIKEGKIDIVIGARSAIFAPLENIGVIIVDEEHSSTYKQENTPRYSAIDIAKQRCSYYHCPLILGSATPSLESYARVQKNVYHLIELKERYNKKSLPAISIVDMNKEFKKANSYFSDVLIKCIEEKISKQEQVILFLNRRGYSSFLICSNCGYTEKCPNCDISLTYHKSSNMLRCHYCGYATKRKEKCPECHESFKDFGIGTEKVEEELKKLIPDSKIIRMDIDTTTKKNAHEKIIKSFMNRDYNVLLGTQMISKGLDFPNVTLVGVINADLSLNFPDFRSSEVTFQLLSQVSGRSGRGQKDGEVIIQTFNPDHYAIRYTANNNYLGFYQAEMQIRKKLSYPPYYYICSLKIISKNYDDALQEAQKIGKYLKNNLQEIILGPSLANVFRINNQYRFQIIIKYKNIDNIMKYLSKLQEHYFNDKTIKLEIDFNPYKI